MKKYFGIALLITGVIGFFYFTNQKSNKRIFNESISTKQSETLELDLKAGISYEFKFWGFDEEMTGIYTPPYFEAQIKVISDQCKLLFKQTLISIHEIETAGKRITHDGLSYEYTPQTDEKITIQVKIKEGDYIDIEAYKNLSSEADALPGLSIILALMGLVLFWRNKVKFRTE